MSVPQNKPVNVKESTIKAAILDAISELWDEHEEQIQAIRDRSQEKCITVSFGNVIDCSESQPTVQTKLRFCETHTDERTNKITEDDKQQLRFESVESAGRGGRRNDKEETEPIDGN